MKKAVLYVAAIAALSIAGQAFAKGGSMGGTMASTSTHPMTTMSHSAASASSMKNAAAQGTMTGKGAQGTMAGQSMPTTAQGTMQGSTTMAGHQSGASTATTTSGSK